MDPNNVEYSAEILYQQVKERKPDEPGFYYSRCVWVSPTQIQAVFDLFKQQHPEEEIEVVDLYTFFDLFKQHYGEAEPH